MELDNKAEVYRKMLGYLETLGADLTTHSTARLAGRYVASFTDMSETDLMHYQRVLEATADYRHRLMSEAALQEELGQVVSERVTRGYVEDQSEELRELRQRLASLATAESFN